MDTASTPLGAFLRAHRERLTPQQAACPPDCAAAPRAAPGGSGAVGRHQRHLADLAGTGPQRIGVGADAGRLAAALQLSGAETDYLFDLAGLKNPQEKRADANPQRGRYWKRCCRASTCRPMCWTGSGARCLEPGGRRTVLRLAGPAGRQPRSAGLHFPDAGIPRFIDNWPERAAAWSPNCGPTWPAAGRRRNRRHAGALRRESPDFDRLWQQQYVLEREGGERGFHHPLLGRLQKRQITLRPASAPEFKLVMLL
ncbi:Uncharacterised protein [Chromobacterium violaceum]|uniref:MmyB-like transcription regulator ligand binding domain-containing protein n=1 Tax=Chromobacterium violaceum TaxID=536 RepID=A0A447TFA0_CHRVL|nr:Uncharacterised protein [Chromobacterium violaceum]